jgi:hypothetical protein
MTGSSFPSANAQRQLAVRRLVKSHNIIMLPEFPSSGLMEQNADNLKPDFFLGLKHNEK